MKRNKLIVAILIGVLLISAVVLGVFHLINGDDSFPETSESNETALTEEQYQRLTDEEDLMPEANGRDEIASTEDQDERLTDEENSMPETDGGDEMALTEEDVTLLTEEQYQLLTDSILPGAFEEMSNVERRNAWLMLDAMAEVEFFESNPSQSGVGRATWILGMLSVGEIQELTVVRVEREIDDFTDSLVDDLIIRIVNGEDSIYYVWYQRSSGLGMVTTDSEDGEMIYNRVLHTIRDGQICEREYPRGPIRYCRD